MRSLGGAGIDDSGITVGGAGSATSTLISAGCRDDSAVLGPVALDTLGRRGAAPLRGIKPAARGARARDPMPPLRRPRRNGLRHLLWLSVELVCSGSLIRASVPSHAGHGYRTVGMSGLLHWFAIRCSRVTPWS